MDQNQKSSNSVDRNQRLLALFILPSWLSGVISIFVALSVVLAVIFMSHYQGSTYQKQIADNQASQNQRAFPEDFDDTEDTSLSGVAPLLGVWSVIGLVIYLLSVNIVKVFQDIANLKSQLNYVNSSRNDLLKEVFGHLAIRVGVAIIWLLYILFFFHQMLPYCISVALAASAAGLLTVAGIGYFLMAVVIIALGMHVHTILLRLVMLKPRVFTKALYIN